MGGQGLRLPGKTLVPGGCVHHPSANKTPMLKNQLKKDLDAL